MMAWYSRARSSLSSPIRAFRSTMSVSELLGSVGERFGTAPSSRERVEKIHVRLHRPVDSRHLGIARLDDVVFVRRVGPAPMAQPENAGRHPERLTGERHPGPRAGQPGPEQRIDPRLPVGCHHRLDQLRIRIGLGRVVAPGKLHLDVAEAVLGQVRLEQLEGALGRHVRHQTEVELGYGPARQDGLPTRAGPSGHQALDVDRGLRHQPELGVVKRLVAEPALDPQGPLHPRLALFRDRCLEDGLLPRGERLDLAEEPLDRRGVAVRLDECAKSLHQVPDRAVDRRLEAGVNVDAGAAAPLLPARHQFHLDDALGAEVDFDRPVGRLAGQGNDDAERFPERGFHFGLEDDLAEVGRSDLLFPLAHQHQIDRELLPGRREGVQRGEEGGLRPLGIGRPAAHDHLAEAGLVHQPGLERRRAPLGGVVLLDVVHEVDGEGVLRPGVDGTEDARLARRGNQLHLLEAGLPRQPGHVLGPLRISLVLRGDGWEGNPVLEHFHGGVVLPGDLGHDGGLVLLLEREGGPSADRDRGGAGGRSLDKGPAVERLVAMGIHGASGEVLGRDPYPPGAVPAIVPPRNFAISRRYWLTPPRRVRTMIAISFRHALRSLRRTPAFTLTAILTLVIGVGAVAAIFAVVNGVLLKPLPDGDPGRLVGTWHDLPPLSLTKANQTAGTYFTYKKFSRSIENIGVYQEGAANVSEAAGASEPQRLAAAWVTASLIPTLQVLPLLGRNFSDAEDLPRGPWRASSSRSCSEWMRPIR